MASKAKIERFDKINKANVKGRIGHSRTGACTARGRCTCKKQERQRLRTKSTKKGRL